MLMKMSPTPPAVLVHLVDGDHHELRGQRSARLRPLLGVSHRCSRPGRGEPVTNRNLLYTVVEEVNVVIPHRRKYLKLQVKVLH